MLRIVSDNQSQAGSSLGTQQRVRGLHFILCSLDIFKQNGFSSELLLMLKEKSNVISYFQINVCVFIYLILHLKNKFDVSKIFTCKTIYNISIFMLSGKVLKVQESEPC